MIKNRYGWLFAIVTSASIFYSSATSALFAESSVPRDLKIESSDLEAEADFNRGKELMAFAAENPYNPAIKGPIIQEAMDHLQEAIAKGHVGASILKAQLLWNKGDIASRREAVVLMEAAQKKGNNEAALWLAHEKVNGISDVKNQTRSRELFQFVLNSDNPQFKLAALEGLQELK